MKRLIADQNIPFVEQLFSQHFQVQLLPFEKITNAHIKDADILLIRSSTNVNEAFIADSNVELIASPTTGVDHLNTDLLDQNNIQWRHAPACNANAVVDYVLASIAWLQQGNYLPSENITAGIIGVGNIGKRLKQCFELLGYDVLLSDPPRAELEPEFISNDLTEFSQADLICCHAPLTKSGKHPTFQILNAEFFSELKKDAVLLNAGRGDVIHQDDLLMHGKHLQCCLDVWPHEPDVNLDLVNLCLIATPHIAGHTIEARERAVKNVYQQICDYYGLKCSADFSTPMKEELSPNSSWQQLVLNYCDVSALSHNFKRTLMNSANKSVGFKQARDDYIARHEISRSLLLDYLAR